MCSTARRRKKHIFYKAKNTPEAGELDFTYFNAVYTVENALAKVKDEKGMKRVEKFLRTDVCPDCGGSRLAEAARAPRLRGIGLDEACKMTLTALCDWVDGVPASLPPEMRPMAESICESLPRWGQAADGFRAGLSDARPCLIHPFHRGAPADAAGPRRAQPHHWRALCAG